MINSFGLRGAGRFNNFDFLRLFLAVTVLFGHCYSVTMTGDSLDPIFRLTHGALYSGGLAVDAFFIISGYLITASWINRPQIGNFLRNRALRIFPAYAMVCLLCAFVVAPLGGAALHTVFGKHAIVDNVVRTVALSTPRTAGAFSEMYKPDFLNGSLWTIRNEFICYMLVLVLGCFDLYTRRSRYIVGALCAISLVGFAIHSELGIEGHYNFPVFGDLNQWPRLAACYLCGMTFRLYRDRILYSKWIAAACLAAICLTTWQASLRSIIVPTAGSYLLFYFAFNRTLPLQRFGARGDISYGMYLYGWPIQQLTLHWINPQMSPYLLFPLAFAGTTACAILSWKYIEKPCMRRKASGATDIRKPATVLAEPRLAVFREKPAALSVEFVFKDSALPLEHAE